MMYSFAFATCCETSGSVSGSFVALDPGKAPGTLTPGVVAVEFAPVVVLKALAGLEETSFAEDPKALVVCSAHSEAGVDTGCSLIFKDIESFVVKSE